MLKDIVLGFKLLRYGYKIKLNVIMVAIFLVVGFIVEFSTKGTNLIGGFYFMIIGMFIYQMLMSMDIANYVASSPMQRKLQIDIPVFTSAVFYLVVFSLLLVERAFFIKTNPENEAELIGSLMMIILMMFATYIFSSICYKYFIVGFILFMVIIFCISFASQFFFGNAEGNIVVDFLTLPQAGLIGYVVILVGTLIQYAIGSLLYRKPLSEFAFRGIFKDM